MSLNARRPFRREARSPQVRVVNFPAWPLDIRRHPLVVRASRTDARSPWLAAPLIHRTRCASVSDASCSSARGFAIASFSADLAVGPVFAGLSPCELLGVATTSSPRGLPPPIHAHAGHTPSSPGESHPEALTEPCLTVSSHTARAIHRRLPPSAETNGFLRVPVDPEIPARMTHLLRSTGVTPLHRYYEVVRTCLAHRYFRPHGFSACAFSLRIASQGLKFRTEARTRVTPPLHRTPHGQ